MEEKETEKLAEVIRIGSCAYCETHSRLKQELCGKCHEAFKDFGPKGWKSGFGHIMRQCRKNPKLAKMIYEGLKVPEAKKMFAIKFGGTD